MPLPPDITTLATILADGGPLAQGCAVGGVLLALVAVFANTGRTDRVSAWVVALLPTTLVCSVPVAASVGTARILQRTLDEFVVATHTVRLAAIFDTLTGLTVGGSLALFLVSGAGALTSGLSAASRGTRPTPTHALVPTIALGGVAAAFPAHHAVVLAAVIAMVSLLSVTLRAPRTPWDRWQTVLHVLLLATAAVGIEHGLAQVPDAWGPLATSPTVPAWSLCIATILGAAVALFTTRRSTRTHLLVLAGGVGSSLAVGWLLQTPLRAQQAMAPENDRVRVRARLATLVAQDVAPPVARASTALTTRPVLLVRTDVLMLDDDVLAYEPETSSQERTRMLRVLPPDVAIAVDADASWSDHAELWSVLAAQRVSVDAVVRCAEHVLCAIPIRFDSSGMRIPDDMLWSEVVERHGGHDDLAIAPLPPMGHD